MQIWRLVISLTLGFIFCLPAFVTSAQEQTKNAKAKSALAKYKAKKNRGWAYKKVKNFSPPNVKDQAWAISDIDYFILKKLEDKQIAPSTDAEKYQFIRRATLDSWGMVPTPEEVTAFQNDTSAQAYENLVDRLLSSPRFGVRQAKRWLDLARYADSAGYESDDTRANMWRYRDYVVDAFNQDKPFDQFILEQLAGDELWPENQQAMIATGFLASAPDSGTFRDFLMRKYVLETDMTNMVGETLLASRVGCARCHDHKFDDISQKEYFQLQSFFVNSAAHEELLVRPGTETQWDIEYQKQQAIYDDATLAIRKQQTAILDQIREEGFAWRRGRYFPNARASIYKPQEQWTPLDRWVNQRADFVEVDAQIMRYLRATQTEEHAAYKPIYAGLWKEYQKLQAKVDEFKHLKPKRGSKYYTAISDVGAEPGKTYIRYSGIHERPTDAVDPAIPALWDKNAQLDIQPTASSTGRRTALAQWIASSDNPLTARVFVNRIWSHYFERGIAANVGDFGRAGSPPTHPKLLDYLAYHFMENGWSVKSLTRQIMLSRTYRQSSVERPELSRLDPKNELLAVYPRKRLDAEQIRDSLLYVSGLLDETYGGPAVFPKMPEHMVKGNKFWEANAPESDSKRRSIYTFVRRGLPYAFTSVFDAAEANNPHLKRDVSTTPLQALAVLNSEEVFSWSQSLAGRIINDVGFKGNDKLNRLYEILFARQPSRAELNQLNQFLAKQESIVMEKSWSDQFAIAVPTGVAAVTKLNPIKASAFVDLVHAMSNSNEFVYRF
ncbi:hypothetical protein C2869_22065 (plasmid) [Saccharobesus litoralis]|uniref:DUF1553 domain-containing protein n=1 Tax=Saccharobesus litoralis TaxID=2172099 RepID=A0A2S0VYI1_9ALTE|nr:DUF1549 and DUF1553 domain-containing protein [Saccharobesus litoralis]AWB69190.1 hypothetical protein C2869_22065 [Saccharobesus litoralis]